MPWYIWSDNTKHGMGDLFILQSLLCTLKPTITLLLSIYNNQFLQCFESGCSQSNSSATEALELLLKGKGNTNTDFNFEHSQKTTHNLTTCMRNLPILIFSSGVYYNQGCVNEKECYDLACRGLNMLQPWKGQNHITKTLNTSVYLALRKKKKIISIIMKCSVAKKNHRHLRKQISSASAH